MTLSEIIGHVPRTNFGKEPDVFVDLGQVEEFITIGNRVRKKQFSSITQQVNYGF